MHLYDIEIAVEKMTDKADRQYMNGDIDEFAYRYELDRIAQWAKDKIKQNGKEKQ